MNARWLSAPAVLLALVSCPPSPAPTTPAMTTTTTTTTAPSREDKVRALIAAVTTEKFDQATVDFDDTMKSALPAAKLADAWHQVVGSAGAFQKIETIEAHDEKHDGHVIHVLLATSKLAHAYLAFRVVFDEQDRVTGFFIQPANDPHATWDAPSYATPSAFSERSVQVGTAPALPGTLTLPNGKGPFPAVILVHGSGPQDRDETIMSSKPFKDLAWGLASKGVAVLRYEKRSKVAPHGVVTQKEEVIDAVHDALALLAVTPEIDHQRVYVAGHSQGGYLAPRIAEREPSVKGIIMLAGSTIPLEDSLVNQLTYFSSLAPDDEGLKKQITGAQQFKQKVESPSLRSDEDVAFPIGGASVKGAYFLDVRDYRPIATASRLSCRILVLQGERDYQVTTREFADWKAGVKNATFHSYPSLNHLFMSGEGTPAPAEYARPGQHVDAQVVIDIATWIKS